MSEKTETCPTCGSLCRIHSGDEGTNSFIPYDVAALLEVKRCAELAVKHSDGYRPDGSKRKLPHNMAELPESENVCARDYVTVIENLRAALKSAGGIQ